MESKKVRSRTVVVSRTESTGNEILFRVPEIGFIATHCEILGAQTTFVDGTFNYLVTTSMSGNDVICILSDGAAVSSNSSFMLKGSPIGEQSVHIWTATTKANYDAHASITILEPATLTVGHAFNMIMRFT